MTQTIPKPSNAGIPPASRISVEHLADSTRSARTALPFAPVQFLHPVRVKRLRPLNLTVFGIWCATGFYALLASFDAPKLIEALFVASGIYLYVIGAVLQFLPKLGARAAETRAEF